ncbi:relaxase/mobilization nuclease domain-containing protein [Alistipes sp. OttesenSCG-928-L06]|nr:relaxase/mobilization nuclease domain-containing protein [Alistipes sp. OttesenSCG-928-L06]
MIAKISTGNSFSATVNYVLDEKKSAELIDSAGVRLKDKRTITDSFLMQQEMNPTIRKPVYHISLGFSAQDMDKLTNEKMSEIAREYMRKMGIDNTQYIVVRHHDKEHPHIHLCINRIDNNGQLISNQNDRYRSERICKELTEKQGLYFAPGKDQVKRHRLKEPDKTKYEIYDTLKELISQCTDWPELTEKLARQGIQTEFVYKGKTAEIQGVVFTKNNYSFNGSKVDKSLSYSKISQQLGAYKQSIRIRDGNGWGLTREQSKLFEYKQKSSAPSLNNIYSEEESQGNNRKRKRRL